MNFVKPLLMASLMATASLGASAAKFTPELLNSLGRVSDAQVSPDAKKVLYGVSFLILRTITATANCG